MPRSVVKSADFLRILNLPKRDLVEDSELAAALTKKLKTPNGNLTLHPIQAAALKDLYENGGLFAPMAVGTGKTLVSLLAPVLLEAERPLLLIPATLKNKTSRDLQTYGEHFQMPDNLKVLNYELLSRERGKKEFELYKPDLIIADECHKLKNTKAACTRRVHRHMKDYPETVFVALSGTMTSKSLMDYWHIIEWCLGQNAPVPTSWQEATEWAMAIDAELRFKWTRYFPGALTQFLDEAVEVNRKNCVDVSRAAYRGRLISTPGVIATAESRLGTSLLVKTNLLKLSEKLDEHFKKLRETWTSPNGEEFSDALRFYSFCQQIATGFYYKWKVPAPEAWAQAQKEWASYARNIIKTNRRGLDTEFEVWNAVERGEYPGDQLTRWKAIKDSFTPANEPIWLSSEVLDYAAAWLEKEEGLVWVKHKAFGEWLAKKTGVPLFADSEIHFIEDHSGPAILAINANKDGKNLQKWNKNLIIDCPASGVAMEQLIGRTHRYGQTADLVTVEVLVSCYEHFKALQSCISQARYVKETQNSEQKLLFADMDLLSDDQIKSLLKSDLWSWKK